MKNNYIDLIRGFNLDPEVQKCLITYEAKSLPGILSVTRRELSHSAFIAELLKDKSFHGLGNYPLSLFLQLILARANKQQTKNLESRKLVFFPELESAVLSQTLNPSNISVQPEWSFKDTDGNSGRVDILIRCKVNVDRPGAKPVQALNLVVENKVYASEQDSQTAKYYKHFNALLHYKASDKVGEELARQEAVGPRSRYNLYVYLTPLETKVLDTLKEPECDCKECVQINYQDLVDGVIEPMLSHPAISERGRFILNEYLRSLSVSFDTVEEKTQNPKARTMSKTGNGQKNIQQIILAVGKEEREQLGSLWGKYSPLLIAAVNEKNNDSDDDDDDVATGRQYYGYKGQAFSMSRLVEAVISDRVGDYTFAEIESIFSSIGFKIISKDKKTAYFENPAPFTKDSFAPYIQKNWTQPGFQRFVEIVKKQWGLDIKPYKEEVLSPKERLCLLDFYNAHESLITTTLEVVKRTTSDSILQEEVESMLKRNVRRRDMTTYSIVLDGTVREGLSWGHLVLTIVQDFAKTSTISKAELIQSFGLSNSCVKGWTGDARGYSGYFIDDEEHISLQDGEYVIKRGWSKKAVEDFITKAKALQYEISEEE